MSTISSKPVNMPLDIPPMQIPPAIVEEAPEVVVRQCTQLATSLLLTEDAVFELKLMAYGPITSAAAKRVVERKFPFSDRGRVRGEGASS